MGKSAACHLACHFWVLNNPSLFDPVLVDIFSTVLHCDTPSHTLTFPTVNPIWSRQGNEML